MPNAARLLPLLLIAPLSLTACGTAGSSPPSACPIPVAYSPEFQAQLATELEALPQGTAMERAIIDYGRERAELRACER